jgi:hypothetical protein
MQLSTWKAHFSSNSFHVEIFRGSVVTEPLLTHLYVVVRWANEGRQLWRGDTIVEPPKVHPYSSVWGRLLDKGKHCEL